MAFRILPTGQERLTHQIPEYRAWKAMKRRCYNPNAINYRFYGGKGVSVCDRWKNSYRHFVDDVGPRPSPLYSLDRYPNQKGNYEPGNVRWATKLEQSRNMVCCGLVAFRGETKTASEWAQETGIKQREILRRLRRGWSVERALTYPCTRSRPNLHDPDWLIHGS